MNTNQQQKKVVITIIVSFLLGLSVSAIVLGNEPAMPGVQLIHPEPMTPEEARAYEQQYTTEGTMGMMLDGGEQVESEIAELARGLKYDPNSMYKFVYDNIEYTPIWGDVKGAYMCLMDRSGNCFDQASLLIALLKEAEKKNGQSEAVCKVQDPHYVYGYIGIPLDQSASWLGVTANASVVGNILSYALIPHTGVTSIGHVWVKVYLDETNDGIDNGSYYVFDPSLKNHNIKVRLSDETLASAMQYEQSSFITDALEGSESGDHSIRNLNTSNISSKLASYSSNLINYIKTNLPAGTIDDIIGGKTIIPTSEVPRQMTLPYELSSPPPEEWTGIPPEQQTTLQIVHEGIDQTLNSSTIYGRRLTITYNGNLPQLKLDGEVLATGTAVELGVSKNLRLVFNHPYTAADRTNNNSITTGYMYCIVNGWAYTGVEIIENRRRKLQEYIHEGLAGSSEEVTGESLNIIGLTWLAQYSRQFYMTDQLSDTTTTIYHLAGVCGQKQNPYIDLPACTIGQSSSNTSRRIAGYYTSAGLGSALEWGVVEQLQPYTAVSTVKLLDIANNRASLPTPSYDRIFVVDSNEYWTDVLKPILASNGSYSTSELNWIEIYVKNYNYRAIVPEYGDLGDGTWQGIGFLVINPGETSIGYIISGDLKGGYGSSSWNISDYTQPIVEPKPFSLPAPTYTSTFAKDPIDLHTGSYFYEHSDIFIGNDFNLEFKRTYDSISRLEDGPLGLGWNHNFHIKAEVCSDGFQTMGSDSPIDAAASIATIYINIDLCMSSKSLENLMIVNLSQKWLMDQKINNIVTIEQPGNTMQFVKLPDGSYNPPPGKAAKLQLEPDDSFLLKTKHGEYFDFDPNGKITSWYDPNYTVTFTYNNNKLTQVSNDFGRYITLIYDGNNIDYIMDSAGRTVNYTYDGDDNLTSVTDANGFITSFIYDPNSDGQLTQIYYPANPTNPFVTNAYDLLGRVKEQTDANGHTYQYYYSYYRTEEVDPNSFSGMYKFNDLGRTIAEENQLGEEVLYEYDGQQRQTLVTYPRGNSVQYLYDENHNVTQITQIPIPTSNEPNIVESFVYEPNFNRVIVHTDPNGDVTTFSYYSNGKLKDMNQPEVDGVIPHTHFTYNSYGQKEITIDAEGMVTKYEYDPNTGDLLRIIVDYGTDPNNLNITTEMTYNLYGDVNSVMDPRGNTTTFQYGPMRRLIRETAPSPFSYVKIYEYDPEGNLELTKRQTGDVNNPWQVTSYTYTPTGKMETITDPNGDVTRYEYDLIDRLWKTFDANNNVTEQLYDPAGRLWRVIDAEDNNSIIYTYTINGKVETLTDAKGNTTTYKYDDYDRLEKTFYPDFTYEQLSYDERDNIVEKRTRADQIIRYKYDPLSRLEKKILPGPQEVRYKYDLVGRLLKVTDANGTIRNNLDRVGRLDNVVYPDGKTVSYQYDDAGNRTMLTYPDYTYVTYEYDELNRLTHIYDQNSNVIVHYDYDDLSRRTGAQYANGSAISYSYDIDDKLLSLDNQLISGSHTFTYSYDKVGNKLTMTVNGLELHRYSYDKIYQLTGVDYPMDYFADDTIFSYDSVGNRDETMGYISNNLNQYTAVDGTIYDYDNNGNLTYDGKNTYTYDAENRLTSAVTPQGSVTYNYDPMGRRISKTIHPSLTTIHYCYDGDQIICEYDGSGNLVRKFLYGTGIDEIVRMTILSKSANIVDMENRIDLDDLEILANSWLCQSGQGCFNPIADRTGDEKIDFKDFAALTNIWLTFEIEEAIVNFADFIVLASSWMLESDEPGFNPDADLMPNGRIDYQDLNILANNWLGAGGSNTNYSYYYHYDGLGSVVALSNENGDNIETYEYDVYGQIDNASLVGNPYLFTGRRWDTETGLHYYRARMYNPTIGRFLQADPIGYKDGTNLYVYVGNNPAIFVDPFGLCRDSYVPTAGEWAGAIVSGIGEGLYNVFVDPFVASGDYYNIFRASGMSPVGAGLQSANMTAGKMFGYGTLAEGLIGIDTRSMRPTSGWERAGQIGIGTAQTALSATVAVSTLHSARSTTSIKQLVSKAQKAYPKKAGRIENHHIKPLYLGGTKEGPKVGLNAAYHQQITNAFRREYGYGLAKPGPGRVREIMNTVYSQYPLP